MCCVQAAAEQEPWPGQDPGVATASPPPAETQSRAQPLIVNQEISAKAPCEILATGNNPWFVPSWFYVTADPWIPSQPFWYHFNASSSFLQLNFLFLLHSSAFSAFPCFASCVDSVWFLLQGFLLPVLWIPKLKIDQAGQYIKKEQCYLWNNHFWTGVFWHLCKAELNSWVLCARASPPSEGRIYFLISNLNLLAVSVKLFPLVLSKLDKTCKKRPGFFQHFSEFCSFL